MYRDPIASEASAAQAARVAIKDQELASLKAELRCLDVQVPRRQGHQQNVESYHLHTCWCDKSYTLIEYKKACQLTLERKGRLQEQLLNIRISPSLAYARPDLLASSFDSRAREFYNQASTR